MSMEKSFVRTTHPLRTRQAIPFIFLASVLALLPALLHAQGTSVQVPSETPLAVELPTHIPMKAGEPLEGRLLYPVYVDNRIAIPAGSILSGTVIRLNSDRSRRIHSRLNGDFTPFYTPVVLFNRLILPDGTEETIVTDRATDGVPILRLSTPAAKKKGSFIRRQIDQEKQTLKDASDVFTKPGRGDRLVQFIYTQLPYHPQRVETGTSWTVVLAQPLELKNDPPDAVSTNGGKREQTAGGKGEAIDPPPEPGTEWRLRAYLKQTISSAQAKPGDTFEAWVAQPVFNAHRVVVVPQGSVLIGEITQSKPARSFGRQGKLRFSFRELKFPSGFTQPVEGSLAGVDANKEADLQLDSEGGVQPKSQNRVIVPLALTLLAGRALDNDGSQIGHSAVASNGFGIVGRVVGIVASSPNVAAGIGSYGAALSIYNHWLTRGHDVVFKKNTRIEVTTTPTHSPLLGPAAK